MRISFPVILAVIGATTTLHSALAQTGELTIMSRAKDVGWSAAPPITKRTSGGAIKMLQDRGTLKPGDRVNVEEEMPKRLSGIYLTIHHVGGTLQGDTLKEKLRKWQISMQGSYNFPKTDKAGNTYTFHAVPGDIPYHFLVAENGDIAVGRDLEFGVFSNTDYLNKPKKDMTPTERSALDAELRERKDPPMLLTFWRNEFMPHHITVVLEGNFEGNDKTKPRELKGRQREQLVDLLAKLAKEHNIAPDHITFHKDVAKGSTPCPGINVINEMDKLKQEVAQRFN